jgi:catechol 2,3-dioxygenase-like lactoylglutathione lyase family enzyme
MIIAVHALMYSKNADAARAFFRDTLKLKFVDAGGGWPIFALPPTEIAVHPTENEHAPELYLMCDDVQKTVAELRAKGVEILKPVEDQGYGLVTSIRIPGNIEFGLYEPRHKLAVSVKKAAASRPRSKSKTKSKAKRARRR